MIVIERHTRYMVVHRDAKRQLRRQIQGPFVRVDAHNRDLHVPIFPECSRSRGYSLPRLGRASRLHRKPPARFRIPPQPIIGGIRQELPDLLGGRFHCGDGASAYAHRDITTR